jgi:thiosulfate/3-mercaptopyruvate sulfurtransferase
MSETTILPDSLVSTSWLAAHLSDPDVRVADVRGHVRTTDLGGGHQRADYLGAREEYDAAHIPGSVYIDWTVDIVDLTNPVPVQLASPDRFARAMSERGIGDATDVVIVDHAGGHFATRLWWALKYYGHDRSAVLEGGYARWVAEARPVVRDASRPRPAEFTPVARPGLRVDIEEVRSLLNDGRTRFIDARDPGQYRGEIVRGERRGHLPGAVNVPAKELLTEHGDWKPLAEQERLLANAGIGGDHRVIAYCNGGVTATAVLFSLHRTGHTLFANYDGSWNEWGGRVDTPVVEGDDG